MRGMAALIKAQLATTVFSNPGPGVRRERGEGNMRSKRERRYQRWINRARVRRACRVRLDGGGKVNVK